MRYYTLKATDVRRINISAFNRIWRVSDFIGRITPSDVGKRVYCRNGILQVENDEQRSTRIATGSIVSPYRWGGRVMIHTRFRDLAIGASFDFINDEQPLFNSFYLRCRKISARAYVDERGIEHCVGSTACVVHHVSAGEGEV